MVSSVSHFLTAPLLNERDSLAAGIIPADDLRPNDEETWWNQHPIRAAHGEIDPVLRFWSHLIRNDHLGWTMEPVNSTIFEPINFVFF